MEKLQFFIRHHDQFLQDKLSHFDVEDTEKFLNLIEKLATLIENDKK